MISKKQMTECDAIFAKFETAFIKFHSGVSAVEDKKAEEKLKSEINSECNKVFRMALDSVAKKFGITDRRGYLDYDQINDLEDSVIESAFYQDKFPGNYLEDTPLTDEDIKSTVDRKRLAVLRAKWSKLKAENLFVTPKNNEAYMQKIKAFLMDGEVGKYLTMAEI